MLRIAFAAVMVLVLFFVCASPMSAQDAPSPSPAKQDTTQGHTEDVATLARVDDKSVIEPPATPEEKSRRLPWHPLYAGLGL